MDHFSLWKVFLSSPITSITLELTSQKSLHRHYWITLSPIEEPPYCRRMQSCAVSNLPCGKEDRHVFFLLLNTCSVTFSGGLLVLNRPLHEKLSYYQIRSLCPRAKFCSWSEFPCPGLLPLLPMVGKVHGAVLLNSSCTQPDFVFHISIGIAWWEGALCCQELPVGKILLVMYSAIVAQYTA